MPWYQKGREQVWSFIDPLCGSGTLAIEAAMIALDRAPGLERGFDCERWAFMPGAEMAAARQAADDMHEYLMSGSTGWQ